MRSPHWWFCSSKLGKSACCYGGHNLSMDWRPSPSSSFELVAFVSSEYLGHRISRGFFFFQPMGGCPHHLLKDRIMREKGAFIAKEGA